LACLLSLLSFFLFWIFKYLHSALTVLFILTFIIIQFIESYSNFFNLWNKAEMHNTSAPWRATSWIYKVWELFTIQLILPQRYTWYYQSCITCHKASSFEVLIFIFALWKTWQSVSTLRELFVTNKLCFRLVKSNYDDQIRVQCISNWLADIFQFIILHTVARYTFLISVVNKCDRFHDLPETVLSRERIILQSRAKCKGPLSYVLRSYDISNEITNVKSCHMFEMLFGSMTKLY